MTANRCKGQALLVVVVFLGVTITFASLLTRFSVEAKRLSARRLIASQALAFAESGLEIATSRLAEDVSYKGETLSLEDGKMEINIDASPSQEREKKITVSAEYGYGGGIRMRSVLKATVRIEDRGYPALLHRRVGYPISFAHADN